MILSEEIKLIVMKRIARFIFNFLLLYNARQATILKITASGRAVIASDRMINPGKTEISISINNPANDITAHSISGDENLAVVNKKGEAINTRVVN